MAKLFAAEDPRSDPPSMPCRFTARLRLYARNTTSSDTSVTPRSPEIYEGTSEVQRMVGLRRACSRDKPRRRFWI